VVKVAIVHDFLNQMGGAEYVVKVLREIFPEAPIYTSVHNPSAICSSFRDADIRTSFIQRLPGVNKHARRYLALYPYAFELFDLSGFDVVLSSSSSFAKGVITGPDTCHICYCHNPMRFAWSYHNYIDQEPLSRIAKIVLPYLIHRLRRWDEITAHRVDTYVANSNTVKSRIAKYYRRDSTVIYPPVDTHRFAVTGKDDGYYLIMSRLNPYKRIDVAIEAFNELKLPLKIMGGGRDLYRLKKLAGPTVEFLGRLSDEEAQQCLQSCKAFVFPGMEDFGIAPVEAMACGKPVIAFAGGGALETVIDGVTGIHFHEQTPQAIAEAVRQLDVDRFDPMAIRRHAESFDASVFKERIFRFIKERSEIYKPSPLFDTDRGYGILAVKNRLFKQHVGGESSNLAEQAVPSATGRDAAAGTRRQ
jgi:glycosyltransferase involved in cell wall biosynthesis